MERVKEVKQEGVGTGNWLTKEEADRLQGRLQHLTAGYLL